MDSLTFKVDVPDYWKCPVCGGDQKPISDDGADAKCDECDTVEDRHGILWATSAWEKKCN